MDYNLAVQNLKDYYANLLIVQYNGLPKASATIKMLVDLMYINAILMQIRDGFNWETAVGKQLDIIGQWVGVSRSYNGSLFWNKQLLSYPEYSRLYPTESVSANQHGYSDYETFDEDGGILTYKDAGFVEQSLNDDDYRTVIGLKIIKNSINHVAGEIDQAIWDYFGGQVYTTWLPHQIIYHYPESLSTIINVCETKGVLIAPTGVEIITSQI